MTRARVLVVVGLVFGGAPPALASPFSAGSVSESARIDCHADSNDAEACGLPSSHEIGLVDDVGRRYAFEPLGPERSTKSSGHFGATLFDGQVAGVFPAKVDRRTRFVRPEIRPKNDRACSPIDFRWNFASPAG